MVTLDGTWMCVLSGGWGPNVFDDREILLPEGIRVGLTKVEVLGGDTVSAGLGAEVGAFFHVNVVINDVIV